MKKEKVFKIICSECETEITYKDGQESNPSDEIFITTTIMEHVCITCDCGNAIHIC